MVIVIVTNPDAMDRRQIFKTDARSAVPLRACELNWTDAQRPNRIRQEIQSLRLEQDRGMIHPGDPKRAAVHLIGRLRAWLGVDPWPPRPNPPVPHPLERVEKAVHFNSGIEEASVAKMLRDR